MVNVDMMKYMTAYLYYMSISDDISEEVRKVFKWFCNSQLPSSCLYE